MSPIHNKGMGLIEVVIAIFLTSVGLLAILSLQSTGWKTAARSDYLGRAAGIMQKELETNEAVIMNPCLPIPASSTKTVYASGGGNAVADGGDARFTVQTNIANDGANIWRIAVTVTWPPINSNGITETLVVTGQGSYRFPVGCVPVR